MHNDILSLGPLTVHGYGLMIGIGIVCALGMIWRRAERAGHPADDGTSLVLLVVITGFLGAKVLFLITCFDQVLADPLATLGSEGFVVYGGIAAGLAAIWFWCRRKGQDFLEWLDLTIPAVAVGQGFGRIGCFLAGCCYGAPTASPLGVVFPAGSLAPGGVPLWPTQLFSSAGDFLLAGALLLLERRSQGKERLLYWYLMLYGVGRFLVEFLRNDPRGSVGTLSTSQFISLFAVAAGVLLRLRERRPSHEG